jgi:hypothetical protein
MAEAATAPAAGGGRHQRRMRNYLLDRHFQLKYTGYLVAIALALSISLGLILARTARAVVAQSEESVRQGESVVARGREVVAESQKVSAVVQMNIVKDPVYADNPALLDAFKEDAEKQDERLEEQQQRLENQAEFLKQTSRDIAERQKKMFMTLILVLVLLVMGVGIAGIVVTHRVAGPIFKMKRQLRDVGEGHLKMPGKLRKGDELVHFFETFEHMVQSLRDRQQAEIEMLERAMQRLEGQAPEEAMKPLRDLRAEMKAALD